MKTTTTTTRATIKELTTKPRYFYYIIENGQELRVQRSISLEDFQDKNVTIYHYTAKNKDGVIEDKYSVSLEDYKTHKPAGRKSISDKLQALKAQGLSDSDIIALLMK